MLWTSQLLKPVSVAPQVIMCVVDIRDATYSLLPSRFTSCHLWNDCHPHTVHGRGQVPHAVCPEASYSSLTGAQNMEKRHCTQQIYLKYFK